MPRALVTKLITGAIISYQKLVARLERKWERRHPRSFRNYTLFKNGIHSTLIDLNDLLRVWKRIAMENRPVSKMFPSMTRRELYVFRQVPKDLIRATPLMILAPLPGTFLLFPLFFAFPRIFLTRQFWREEQRVEFDRKNVERRMSILPDLLLTDLWQRVHTVRVDSRTSAPLRQHLNVFDSVYNQITSGVKPSIERITELLPLFQGPFALKNLNRSHMVNLCKLHDLAFRSAPSAFGSQLAVFLDPGYMHARRIRRLCARSHLLFAEDRSLRQDLRAAPTELVPDENELITICVLRGIDPFQPDRSKVLSDLKSWVTLSLAAPESNHSFRLHLPVLLFHRRLLDSP